MVQQAHLGEIVMKEYLAIFWQHITQAFNVFLKLREIASMERRNNRAEMKELYYEDVARGSGHHMQAKHERRDTSARLGQLSGELEKMMAS